MSYLSQLLMYSLMSDISLALSAIIALELLLSLKPELLFVLSFPSQVAVTTHPLYPQKQRNSGYN